MYSQNSYTGQINAIEKVTLTSTPVYTCLPRRCIGLHDMSAVSVRARCFSHVYHTYNTLVGVL